MNVDKIIKILENGTEIEKIETLQKLNDISEDIILQKNSISICSNSRVRKIN